jgi:hypothetical protein
MLKLGRDPFARETVTRHRVFGTCDFCGNVAGRKQGDPRVWVFVVEPDGGRAGEVRGKFCSVACCNAYHGW